MYNLYLRMTQITIVASLLNLLKVLIVVLSDKKPDAPKWVKLLSVLGLTVMTAVLVSLLPVLIVAFLVDAAVYWKKRMPAKPSLSEYEIDAKSVLSKNQMIALTELARKNNGWFSITVRKHNGAFSVMRISDEFKLPEEDRCHVVSILSECFSQIKEKTISIFVPRSPCSDDPDEIANRFHIEIVKW